MIRSLLPRALPRRQSALIRRLLREGKTRAREGVFVLEGAKFCEEAIRHHPQTVVSLILSPRYLRTEDDAGRTARARLPVAQFVCSDASFATLSDVQAPQGVMAVIRQPRWDERRVLEQPKIMGIYGDRLQDPANVGAIIRTAAALDLAGVWLSPDSADPFGPKAVRAASGAVLSLPVFREADIRDLARRRCAIYSALVPSPDAVSLQSLRAVPPRIMIAVGNEGEGLAQDIVRLSTVKFTIPLSKGVESLNVAATAAIAAFYLSALQANA
ncbi:MAG: RNA methyltransferase [Nitrospira sp.]|nr:RNA methyltransferase [Nitrospira sp.]